MTTETIIDRTNGGSGRISAVKFYVDGKLQSSIVFDDTTYETAEVFDSMGWKETSRPL
jgi:hypothetical protein